jgi:hypothetical protein
MTQVPVSTLHCAPRSLALAAVLAAMLVKDLAS